MIKAFAVITLFIFSIVAEASTLSCIGDWGDEKVFVTGDLNSKILKANLTFKIGDEIVFKNGSTGLKIKNGEYAGRYSFKLGVETGLAAPVKEAHYFLYLPSDYARNEYFYADIYVQSGSPVHSGPSEIVCKQEYN